MAAPAAQALTLSATAHRAARRGGSPRRPTEARSPRPKERRSASSSPSSPSSQPREPDAMRARHPSARPRAACAIQERQSALTIPVGREKKERVKAHPSPVVVPLSRSVSFAHALACSHHHRSFAGLVALSRNVTRRRGREWVGGLAVGRDKRGPREDGHSLFLAQRLGSNQSQSKSNRLKYRTICQWSAR